MGLGSYLTLLLTYSAGVKKLCDIVKNLRLFKKYLGES